MTEYKVETKFKGINGTLRAECDLYAVDILFKKNKIDIEKGWATDNIKEANVLVTSDYKFKTLVYLDLDVPKDDSKHFYTIYINRVGETVELARSAKEALEKASKYFEIIVHAFQEVSDIRQANAVVTNVDTDKKHLYFLNA